MKNVGGEVKESVRVDIHCQVLISPLTQVDWRPRAQLKRHLEITLRDGVVSPTLHDLIVKHIRHIDDL